jgi:hypothetical protein
MITGAENKDRHAATPTKSIIADRSIASRKRPGGRSNTAARRARADYGIGSGHLRRVAQGGSVVNPAACPRLPRSF